MTGQGATKRHLGFGDQLGAAQYQFTLLKEGLSGHILNCIPILTDGPLTVFIYTYCNEFWSERVRAL